MKNLNPGDLVRLLNVPASFAFPLRVGMVGTVIFREFAVERTLLLVFKLSTEVYAVDFGVQCFDNEKTWPMHAQHLQKIAGDGDISGDDTETDRPKVVETV